MDDDARDENPMVRPCSEAHPDSDIFCYPPEHPVTKFEFPDGTIFELAPGQTVTQEELDLLAEAAPLWRRLERERRAALTPRERRDEPRAWGAVAERGVRARG